jgi:hypothetical protein
MTMQQLADRIKPFLSGKTRRRILRLRMGLRAPTARFRSLPDFLIIGGMRCGTSSLYKYLAHHPAVAPSLRKEIHYLTFDYGKGESWYRSHFPLIARKRLSTLVGGVRLQTFEATPDNVFHPYAAERAARLVPDAKLIVLLRDPVSRAISHYIHNVGWGKEPLPISEALLQEDERISGDLERLRSDPLDHCLDYRLYSYIARGIYVDQLQVWERHYPRSRLLVIRSEDLYERTSETYREILKFLELPQWRPPQFVNYDRRWGADKAHVEIPDEVRGWLSERFEPHNRRLYEWLGRDLGW